MHLIHLSGNNLQLPYMQVRRILRPLSLILFGVLLSGCAASAGYNFGYGGKVTNIDRVIVNQKLSVPEGSRIYLQDGKTKIHSEVKEAAPYCYFHLYRSPSVIETPAVLDVDNLVVTSTSHYIAMSGINQPPVHVASAGILFQDASEHTLLTRVKLQSDLQPEVIGLFCGVWAVPNERSHLSLEEIKRSLGDTVSLELSAG